MAEIYTIKHETLKGIADAIRGKTGATETIAVTDMASQIEGITGGGTGGGDYTVTFMSEDGATVLYEKQVMEHDTCANPVSLGLIDTPTKASTEQYDYTYSGWATTQGGAASSSALANITADKTVYVAFKESARYYTANFYDGETLLKTEQVAYGAQATPPDTLKEGSTFLGWTPSDLTITANTDFIGSWATSLKTVLPEQTIVCDWVSIYGSFLKILTSNMSEALEVGSTYKVVWDDTEYDLLLCSNKTLTLGTSDKTWYRVLGNVYTVRKYNSSNFSFNSDDNTGEPFFINSDFSDTSTLTQIFCGDSNEHKLAIYKY